MKIIVFTDIHGKINMVKRYGEELKQADFILLAGDITHFGDQDEARAVIDAIKPYCDKILAVPGNCDNPGVEQYLEYEGINLHGKAVQHENIMFAGIGGSLPCPGVTPNELSDTSIRALYRNLIKSIVCIKKDAPEQLLKNVQNYENKPIVKIFSQFYDYNKDQFETVLKQLRLLTKKSDEITLDDIKSIQENYRESSYCPFAISFAKFKIYLKENPNTIEAILSADFCNLNSYTIKKLILKSEEILIL